MVCMVIIITDQKTRHVNNVDANFDTLRPRWIDQNSSHCLQAQAPNDRNPATSMLLADSPTAQRGSGQWAAGSGQWGSGLSKRGGGVDC